MSRTSQSFINVGSSLNTLPVVEETSTQSSHQRQRNLKKKNNIFSSELSYTDSSLSKMKQLGISEVRIFQILETGKRIPNNDSPGTMFLERKNHENPRIVILLNRKKTPNIVTQIDLYSQHRAKKKPRPWRVTDRHRKPALDQKRGRMRDQKSDSLAHPTLIPSKAHRR